MEKRVGSFSQSIRLPVNTNAKQIDLETYNEVQSSSYSRTGNFVHASRNNSILIPVCISHNILIIFS